MEPKAWKDGRLARPAVANSGERWLRVSAATKAAIQCACRGGESENAVVSRAICLMLVGREKPLVGVVLARLQANRQLVRELYRSLGWSRSQLEQLLQAERDGLAALGVRLHVADHAAAAGRKERYVSLDGVRYSAISWEQTELSTTPVCEHRR